MVSEPAQPIGDIVAVGQDGAAFPGRQRDLGRVRLRTVRSANVPTARPPRVAPREWPSAISITRPGRGRVGDPAQSLVVGGLAGIVDGEHGLRPWPYRCATASGAMSRSSGPTSANRRRAA